MEVDELDEDSDTNQKNDTAASGSNDTNPHISNLVAAIADLSTRASAAESTLKQQAAATALLDQKYEGCRQLLAEQRSRSLRPQIDKLQSTLLKDIDAYDALRKQLTEIAQASGPLDGRITSLLESVAA